MPSDLNIIETRRRLSIQTPVNIMICDIDKDEIISGTVESLSKNGMLFVSKKQYPLSKILKVDLDLKEIDKKVACLMKISLVEADSEGHVRMGADFIDLSDENKNIIGRYIRYMLENDCV